MDAQLKAMVLACLSRPDDAVPLGALADYLDERWGPGEGTYFDLRGTRWAWHLHTLASATPGLLQYVFADVRGRRCHVDFDTDLKLRVRGWGGPSSPRGDPDCKHEKLVVSWAWTTWACPECHASPHKSVAAALASSSAT